MRRLLAASVLASLVLLAPVASATQATGELVAAGTIELPAGTMSRTAPLALFARLDPSSNLVLELDSARVLVFEKRYVSASAGSLQPSVLVADQPSSWNADDVHVEIDAQDPASWFGLHPRSGELHETRAQLVSIATSSAASVGNGEADPDRADPARPYYLVSITEPSLGWSATDWSYEGGGQFKTMGPTLTLSTSRNTTTIRTGEFSDPSHPGQIVRRWIALDFEHGAITAHGQPATIAARVLAAEWDGEATFGDATGTIRGTIEKWEAAARTDIRVDGAFSTTITAALPQAATIVLDGDMRSSSLSSSVRIPAPTGAPGMPVLLFLLGAVVALAAGATYATKRNRATPDLGPEEYAQLAERAADAEDYARAFHYMGEARRLSPTSRRLAIDHAFFASQAGHADAAIGMLREAILADDADAQLLLTRLLQARGDSDGAARALARALELTPTTLLDVETDPTYEDLMRSDVVQKAARDARRRLE